MVDTLAKSGRLSLLALHEGQEYSISEIGQVKKNCDRNIRKWFLIFFFDFLIWIFFERLVINTLGRIDSLIVISIGCSYRWFGCLQDCFGSCIRRKYYYQARLSEKFSRKRKLRSDSCKRFNSRKKFFKNFFVFCQFKIIWRTTYRIVAGRGHF